MRLETVKVGMVGLGLVVNSHFQGYVTHPHTEVIAVCDTNIENADNFAQRHGIRKVYNDYEVMLKDPEINTIDTATPIFLHIPMTIKRCQSWKTYPLRETILLRCDRRRKGPSGGSSVECAVGRW